MKRFRCRYSEPVTGLLPDFIKDSRSDPARFPEAFVHTGYLGGIRESITTWRSVSVTLNELNRSIGQADAYPFVVNQAVEEKLVYVDSVIRRLQESA